MVEEPDRFLTSIAQAGADIITVHVECFHGLYSTIEKIKSLGKKVGLALNPSTSLDTIDYLLKNVDMLLVMTVDPGFGGQSFIKDMLPKIRKARHIISEKGLDIDLAVDGGINMISAPLVVKEGANLLIAGSAVFKNKNPKKAIEELRQCTE